VQRSHGSAECGAVTSPTGLAGRVSSCSVLQWRLTGWLEGRVFWRVERMEDARVVRDLKSVGPRSEEMLARAGITTIAQLRGLGSVEAFVRTRRVVPRVSLNLLWALESAISGEPWQEVARLHRTSLLLAVDEREKNA
jgi:DNA transformation protein